MRTGNADRTSRWVELSEREQVALSARLERVNGSAHQAPASRIPRRNGQGPVPLSFAQQRLWFLDQLVPLNPFYNIPAVLPWEGPLDLRSLQRAVDELVRRHESLRTTFPSAGATPVQVVHPPSSQRLRLLDLRSVDPSRRMIALEQVAAREATAPFDLGDGPLLRVGIVRLDHASFRLLLTMHHIISDGWSMSVLLRELSALYEAALTGRPNPLPEPELQYADFAVWQRTWLSGQRLEAQLDFWRKNLAELPTLDLVTDFPRPAVATYRGENLPIRIDAKVAAGVKELASEEGVTPFMVLLAAWAGLLHRATGQTDLAIGAPIANRLRPEFEPLIGFFVNSLVLRIDADGDPVGRDLIQRVKETTVPAYAHQELPFEKLVEELRPERDLGRNPFTQVTFQLQNTPTATGELPEDGTPALPQTRTSILDLAFSLWETRGALVGMAQFSTDLFAEGTVRGLMDAYDVLLSDLVERPDVPISRLRLLTADQRQQSIAQSAGPAQDFGRSTSLHEMVVAACEDNADAVAVQGNGMDLTYQQLERWSGWIAATLRSWGVPAGATVGVRSARRPGIVAAYLGIMRAGCAYLPLDPDMPTRRTHRVLAEAQVELVLTDDVPPPGVVPEQVRAAPIPPMGADAGPSPSVEVAPDSTAYVLFTSGSTGTPLGIQVPHRSIVNHMQWMQMAFPLGPGDRVLQRTPVTFDASVWEVWAPLLAGARLVLYPSRWAADTSALLDVLRTERITVLQLVPSLLRLLLEDPGFAMADHLRRVYCGGEALTPDLVERFHRTWRGDRPRELINLYGPTEATIDATAWRCAPGDDHARVPIGRPISNMTAYVLDQYHEPVPDGFPGELYLAGEGLSRGYVDRPELTAERFMPDPFSRRGRLMHRTGDVVRRRCDGALEFLRRADDLVKLRGFRIEPAEIERCLSAHAEVERVLVLPRAGRFDDVQLVAYVAVGDIADDTSVGSDVIDEHVGDWHSLYEDVYSGQRAGPDQEATDSAFDITGWNSSYDGLPIGADEMGSWLEETVARILALEPRRVLEVGAGTGLVALRVAPHVDDYLAVDFSESAVAGLEMAAVSNDAPLRVAQLAAHELDSIDDGDFDVIIFNSVVQYFPGLAYLERALSAAADRLTDDGKIFIGDIRSLPLLAPFHLSVLLHDAGGQPTDRLRALLDERLRQEEELVIDPRWFAGLADRLPGVASVCVRPKAGEHATEMTRFRYDVTLSAEPSPGRSAPMEYLEWSNIGGSLDGLIDALDNRSGPVAVLGIPNDRVGPEALAVAALDRGEPDTRADLLRHVEQRVAGIDPHTVTALVREAGLSCEVLWTRTGGDGSFDLAVTASPDGLNEAFAHLANELRPPSVTGVAAATAPLRRRVGQRLIPAIRRLAEEALPAYMVPSRFVILDRLPLRPNGKIDRAALPSPDGDRTASSVDYVAPDGPLETVLSKIWADVLDLQRVGAADDFFADLGGHSLLATQLVSRLSEGLDHDMALRTVFESSTVIDMATSLRDDLGPADAERLERRAAAMLQLVEMSEQDVASDLRANDGAVKTREQAG